MVKIANNVSILGPLRDIRVVGFKPRSNGNGNGHLAKSAPRIDLHPDNDEALQARERAGYERGKKEAEDNFSRQMETLRSEWESSHRNEVLEALEALNRNVHQQMAETFKSLEKHLIMLAAEAAIKLTAGIPISADMVEAYVTEAMNHVEQDTEVTIILNPDDLALLEQHQSSLLNRAGAYPVIRFRPDPKMGRGGCLIETKFGELDARRETKIEMLKKAVNE